MTSRAGTGSRSREEMLLLMAYADGELDDPSCEDDRARVEAILVADPEARALVSDLTEIAVSSGDWVREAATASKVHASVPTFDIADSVMAAIEKDAEKSAPIDLAARRKQRTARSTQTMATLGMLAVAAAALFVVRGRSSDSATTASNAASSVDVQMDKPAATAPLASAGATGATGATGAGGTNGALAQNADPAGAIPAAPLDVAVPRAGEIEVNAVAAPNHDVTVFYPQAGDTTASVVVWINESKP